MTTLREQLNELEKNKYVIKELENKIFKFINQKDIKQTINKALKEEYIEVYSNIGTKHIELERKFVLDQTIFESRYYYRFMIEDDNNSLICLDIVPTLFKQKLNVNIYTYKQDAITEKDVIDLLTLVLGI